MFFFAILHLKVWIYFSSQEFWRSAEIGHVLSHFLIEFQIEVGGKVDLKIYVLRCHAKRGPRGVKS